MCESSREGAMTTITISRGSASGGELLAKALVDRLGFEIVSREDIVHEASKYGVKEEKLKEALVQPPGFWDRIHHDRRRFLAFVQLALCEHAQKGNIVYHGNAGHLLLRGVSHVASIRLIAPMSYRINVLKERKNMSEEQAIAYINKVDEQRQRWTQFLYGEDCLDPHLYDLTVNLRTIEIPDAVEIAVAALSNKRFDPTDESRQAMDDLLLASRVRAALASDAKTMSAEVDVEASKGFVSLRGKLHSQRLVEQVIEAVGEVDGVEKIDRDNLDAPEYMV